MYIRSTVTPQVHMILLLCWSKPSLNHLSINQSPHDAKHGVCSYIHYALCSSPATVTSVIHTLSTCCAQTIMKWHNSQNLSLHLFLSLLLGLPPATCQLVLHLACKPSLLHQACSASPFCTGPFLCSWLR